MKVNELIQLIEESECYSLYEAADLIDGICEQVDKHLDIDKHRWYSVAIDVYKCEDGFVGIGGLFQIFSEHSDIRDMCVECEAFEMVPVLTTTYKIK